MLIGRRHCMLSRKKWHNDQQSDKVLPDNCSYPIRCELLLAHCWLITRHQPPTSNHPDRIRPMVVLYKWWFCTAVTVQSHVAALGPTCPYCIYGTIQRCFRVNCGSGSNCQHSCARHNDKGQAMPSPHHKATSPDQSNLATDGALTWRAHQPFTKALHTCIYEHHNQECTCACASGVCACAIPYPCLH